MKKILFAALTLTLCLASSTIYANQSAPFMDTIAVSNTGGLTVYKWEHDHELSSFPIKVQVEQTKTRSVVWPSSAHVYEIDYRGDEPWSPDPTYHNDGCSFTFVFNNNGTLIDYSAKSLNNFSLCSAKETLINSRKIVFALIINVKHHHHH